jgi:hypothetical protein
VALNVTTPSSAAIANTLRFNDTETSTSDYDNTLYHKSAHSSRRTPGSPHP